LLLSFILFIINIANNEKYMEDFIDNTI